MITHWTLKHFKYSNLKTRFSGLYTREYLETKNRNFITPLITGNLFLHTYYKRFAQLFIDTTTNLISLHITNPLPPEKHPISIPKLLHSTIRICLPFRMFRAVFNKLHDHSHTGIEITYNTFSQYYYNPYLEKWLSIFIHDCLECPKNKHFNMKIQTAPTQSFLEHASSFNYRISMDTKGPISPPSQHKSYIHVICDAFSALLLLLLLSQLNRTTQKLQLKLYYTIGLPNMAHLFILSLIVAPNT